ncbi:hypothetical protein BKA66DRAFT_470631 [Pyrenochaeta sp. MPI-SDFR-AT-0127]|nr:hypothetical protein BKA66DRAFT_470631 [Pyrenochaeta sp. MPI-SDFR-AT-0127]
MVWIVVGLAIWEFLFSTRNLGSHYVSRRIIGNCDGNFFLSMLTVTTFWSVSTVGLAKYCEVSISVSFHFACQPSPHFLSLPRQSVLCDKAPTCGPQCQSDASTMRNHTSVAQRTRNTFGVAVAACMASMETVRSDND